MATRRQVKPTATPKTEVLEHDSTSTASKCKPFPSQTAHSPSEDEKSLLKSKLSQAHRELEAKKPPNNQEVLEHGWLIIEKPYLGQLMQGKKCPDYSREDVIAWGLFGMIILGAVLLAFLVPWLFEQELLKGIQRRFMPIEIELSFSVLFALWALGWSCVFAAMGGT